MIERAYNNPALSEKVAQQMVRDTLRTVDYGAHNYIFAYTRDSYNLIFRPNPSLEGYSKKSNDKSKQLLNNLFEAGKNGGGFHAYSWKNPASGQEEPKISYALVLDKWDWVIGTGVYIADIDRALATASQAIQADINAALYRILAIALAVVVIGAAIGAMVGRTVTRPLARISRLMEEIASGDGDLTQRLPEDGHDELSELGLRFNGFVGKLQNTIREVGRTTDQVASAAEEINRNVVRIVEAAQRSDTGVTQTNESSRELAQLGESLRELAGQFRV